MSTFNAAKLMVAFGTTGINVLQSDIGQAEGKLRGFQAATASSGKSMTAFASVPIAGFFTTAFLGASSLEQAQGKVDAVFGESAGSINDWANTSATAFGLSKSEALANAGSFGALFQAMGLTKGASVDMSKNIIGLAGDLSAFNDVPVADAVTALNAGLVGETEPLRRFGIVMNDSTVKAKAMEMGLADANGEISESAKVQARYALILEATTTQQGQFAREADGAGGSMAIAKAKFKDAADVLGTQLLPIGTAVISFLGDMAGKVAGLDGPMARIVMITLAVVAAIGPLLIGVSMLIPAFGVLATVIGFVLSPVGLIVAAIVGLGVVLVMAYTHIESFHNAVNAAAGVIAGAFSTMIGWFTSFANYIKVVLTDGDAMNDWLTHLPGPIQGIVAAIGNIIIGLQSFANYIKVVLTDGDILNDWLTHLPGPIQGIVVAIGSLIVGIQNVATAIANWIASGAAVDFLTAAFSAFWSIAGPIIQGAIGIIVKLGEVLISAFAGFMASNYPGMIAGALQGLWSAFQTLWDAVSHGTPIMYALLGVIAVIASPVSLTVAALVALGVALTTAYQKSETFRNIVNGAFEAVGAVVQNVLLPIFAVALTTAIAQVTNIVQFLAAILRGDLGGAFSALASFIMTPIQGLLQILGIFGQAIVQIPILGGVIQAIIGFFTNLGSTVQGASDAAGGAIQGLSNAILGAFQGAGAAVAGFISGAWGMLTGAISGTVAIVLAIIAGLVAGVSATFAAIGAVVTGAMSLIAAAITGGWSLIQSIISGAMGIISAVVTGGWAIVTSIVSGAMALVSAVISTCWSVITGVVSAAVAAISGVVSATWSAISATVSAIVSGLVAILSGLWNGLLATLSGIVSAMLGVITSTWSTISATVSGIVSSFVAVLTSLWNSLLSAITGVVNSILSTVTSTISNMASTAQSTVSSMASAIIGFFSGLLSSAASTVNSIKDGIVNGFNSAKDGAIAAVSGLVSGVKDALFGLIAEAGAIAGDIGGAIIGGLTDSIGGGMDKVKGTLGGLTDKLPSWKGPPERDRTLLKPAGQLIMQGLVDSLESRTSDVREILSSLTGDIGTIGLGLGTSNIGPAFGGGSIGVMAANAGQTVNNTWNISLDLKTAEELAEATAFFGDMERARDIVLGQKGRR